MELFCGYQFNSLNNPIIYILSVHSFRSHLREFYLAGLSAGWTPRVAAALPLSSSRAASERQTVCVQVRLGWCRLAPLTPAADTPHRAGLLGQPH